MSIVLMRYSLDPSHSSTEKTPDCKSLIAHPDLSIVSKHLFQAFFFPAHERLLREIVSPLQGMSWQRLEPLVCSSLDRVLSWMLANEYSMHGEFQVFQGSTHLVQWHSLVSQSLAGSIVLLNTHLVTVSLDMSPNLSRGALDIFPRHLSICHCSLEYFECSL